MFVHLIQFDHFKLLNCWFHPQCGRGRKLMVPYDIVAIIKVPSDAIASLDFGAPFSLGDIPGIHNLLLLLLLLRQRPNLRGFLFLFFLLQLMASDENILHREHIFGSTLRVFIFNLITVKIHSSLL